AAKFPHPHCFGPSAFGRGIAAFEVASSARQTRRGERGLSVISAETAIRFQPVTKTKIALLGSGFIADIHVESYQRFVPEAEVVAVWSRSPERASAFAKKHDIPKHYPTLEQAITES